MTSPSLGIAGGISSVAATPALPASDVSSALGGAISSSPGGSMFISKNSSLSISVAASFSADNAVAPPETDSSFSSPATLISSTGDSNESSMSSRTSSTFGNSVTGSSSLADSAPETPTDGKSISGSSSGLPEGTPIDGNSTRGSAGLGAEIGAARKGLASRALSDALPSPRISIAFASVGTTESMDSHTAFRLSGSSL